MDEACVPATIPEELVSSINAQVRAVHRRLGLDQPAQHELERAHTRALAGAGSMSELAARAAAGRLHEVTDVRPLNLELDIVNKCNLRCVMCMMSHPTHLEQPLERFPVDEFAQLAEQVFWHLNALSLTYGAEPLLHPDFARFVQIAARYRIPRVYAVTNGLLLTEPLIRQIVMHGMHSLVVSIDAATRETYEQIRIGGDWERLLTNLRLLQRVKREAGKDKPLLELAFVLMRSNIRELPAFLELAQDLGASAVYALHMVPFEPLDIGQETCASIKETTNATLRQARETARQLGLNFTCPPEFGAEAGTTQAQAGMQRFGLPLTEATLQRGACPFPWHFVAIDMKGDVVPCGWWQGGAPMGNIHRQTFDAIWMQPAYQLLRAQHRRHEPGPICKRCPAAGVGSVDDPAAFVER